MQLLGTGADPGGGSWGADDPPFQAWISCTSLLCLAKQPALPPSLQLMNLDLTQNIAKNLFVRWKSRAPLTSRAVYLVRGNNVGVAKHSRSLFSLWSPLLDVLDPPLGDVVKFFHNRMQIVNMVGACRIATCTCTWEWSHISLEKGRSPKFLLYTVFYSWEVLYITIMRLSLLCPTYPKSGQVGDHFVGGLYKDLSRGLGICTMSFGTVSITSAHMSIIIQRPLLIPYLQ